MSGASVDILDKLKEKIGIDYCLIGVQNKETGMCEITPRCILKDNKISSFNREDYGYKIIKTNGEEVYKCSPYKCEDAKCGLAVCAEGYKGDILSKITRQEYKDKEEEIGKTYCQEEKCDVYDKDNPYIPVCGLDIGCPKDTIELDITECPYGYVYNIKSKLCERKTLDFSNWEQQGKTSAGRWIVKKEELIQVINGAPTIFLTPDILGEKGLIEGRMSTSSGDDDFMGIVFGWKSKDSFYLFDWKQRNQGSAKQGVRLMKIKYDFNSIPFWKAIPSSDKIDMLDYDFNFRGWTRNKEHLIRIEYDKDFIIVKIDGEKALEYKGQDLDLKGRAGFYNFSQDHVSYKDFNIFASPNKPEILNGEQILLEEEKEDDVGFLENATPCFEKYCKEGIFNPETEKCKVLKCPEGSEEQSDGRCLKNNGDN
jgi:hypothetical protein